MLCGNETRLIENRDGSEKNGFSAAVLKNVAAAAMLTDHLAQSLGAGCLRSIGVARLYSNPLYTGMVYLGRLAFPLYAFLLAEGAYYTHSRRQYVLRLVFFSLVSWIPFNIAFGKPALSSDSLNVFFTLLLGILTIIAVERTEILLGNRKTGFMRILQAGCIIVSCAVAGLLHTDYGFFGIGLILLFYHFRNNKKKMLTVVGVCYIPLFWLYSIFILKGYFHNYMTVGAYLLYCLKYTMREAWGLTALPLLSCYNGERGKQLPKLFYYWFYPVHLLFLWIVGKTLHIL